MRAPIVLFIVSFLCAPTPVLAGTVAIANGQTTWQPTACAEPAAPPSLINADRETSAGTMNRLMTQYNEYVGAMQTYMDCLNREGQDDARTTNTAVIRAVQDSINAAHAKVQNLGTTLKPRAQ